MKFTLTTYDSMLASVVGYAPCCTDIEFFQFLEKIPPGFQKPVVLKKKIFIGKKSRIRTGVTP